MPLLFLEEEFDMYDILTQVIGFVGMGLCISSFACKRSNWIVLLQVVGNGLFIVHFLMLGAYSGCINIAIAVCSNVVLLFFMNGKRWAAWAGWRWLFCLLAALACMATWKDLYSLLPCISAVFFVLTNWTCRETVIRLGKIAVVGPGWIIYNLYVNSYSGVLSESFGIVSALFSLLYYGRRDRAARLEESGPQEYPEKGRAPDMAQPVDGKGGVPCNAGDF